MYQEPWSFLHSPFFCNFVNFAATRLSKVFVDKPWTSTEVERGMMPLKFYHGLEFEIGYFQLAYGPCWEPAIAQVQTRTPDVYDIITVTPGRMFLTDWSLKYSTFPLFFVVDFSSQLVPFHSLLTEDKLLLPSFKTSSSCD
jgi:hypothetical protein